MVRALRTAQDALRLRLASLPLQHERVDVVFLPPPHSSCVDEELKNADLKIDVAQATLILCRHVS